MSSALFIAAVVIVPVFGLAAWMWIVITEVALDSSQLGPFEGLHLED